MICDCNQGRLACSCASSEEPVKSLYMQIERGEVEGMRARIAELEGALSWHEEQPRCGVVLPERMPEVFGNRYPNAVGWNDCLTEVARLNPPGETLAALPDVETSTVLHSAWLRLAGDGQPSVDDLKRYYLAISAALIDLNPPGAGVYSADPMACSGCAGGCFRCAKTQAGECVAVSPDLLIEVEEILTEQNWRGDLVDQIRTLLAQHGWGGESHACDKYSRSD